MKFNLDVQLIEFNAFGAQMASGSALFHWLRDYNVLYGMNGDNYIEVRVTSTNVK